MKVILSRKGSDSVYGGIPSPIFPNNDMRSIPIPNSEDKIKYSDLKFNEQLFYNDLIDQLQQNNRIKKIADEEACHLDPDIYKNVIDRPVSWRPLFGQIGNAQQHLKHEGIKKGDLFLFYGWFRRTKLYNNILRYTDRVDLHVIFGYFQVELIINPKEDGYEDWMNYHPHVQNKKRFNDKTNCLYVARDNLTWNSKITGAGYFNFSENLVLTKKTDSGYLSRSHWTNDFPFDQTVKISRHKVSAWKHKNYFQSTPIGQEFVLEETKLVENWAKELINVMSE